MKKISFIVLFLLSFYSIGFALDTKNIEKSINDISNHGATLIHNWLIIKDNYSKELICVAHIPTNGNKASLVIYEKKDDHKLRKLTSLTLGSFPYFILENNHNLVVVCQTAVGYLVDVFGYKDGIVKRLLSDGSYFPPEFVYVGKDYKNAIVISNLEWQKVENGKDEERIPVSANIYIWNGIDYDTYKKVPWRERLQRP